MLAPLLLAVRDRDKFQQILHVFTNICYFRQIETVIPGKWN